MRKCKEREHLKCSLKLNVHKIKVSYLERTIINLMYFLLDAYIFFKLFSYFAF